MNGYYTWQGDALVAARLIPGCHRLVGGFESFSQVGGWEGFDQVDSESRFLALGLPGKAVESAHGDGVRRPVADLLQASEQFPTIIQIPRRTCTGFA